MDVVTFSSLRDELTKIASGGVSDHLLDLAGLGVLSVPSIMRLRGKPMKKKNEERTELAGLGTLAIPSAISTAKHFMSKRASSDLDLANGALALFSKSAAKTDNQVASRKPSVSGSGMVRDPMIQPLVGDEADWAARTNLVSVRGGADSGRVIPTANQMKTASLHPKEKKAGFDLWSPESGRLLGSEGGTRAANRGLGAAKAVAKPKFTMEHLKKAYEASNLKPGLGSALRRGTGVLKHASIKVAAPFTLGRGQMGLHALGDAFKAAKPAALGNAAKAAKTVADPRRASMLSHFTPQSHIDMSRAISL